MKYITQDTINALMSDDPKNNLLKCGFSSDDIKDGNSLYNALMSVSNPAVSKIQFLITYTHRYKGNEHTTFHNLLVDDIFEWLIRVRKYQDEFTLIAYFPVDSSVASKLEDVGFKNP
jgi:hypothetical protein